MTDWPTVDEDKALCPVAAETGALLLDTTPELLEIIAGTVAKGVLSTSLAVTGQFKLTVDLISLTAVWVLVAVLLADDICAEVETTGGMGGTPEVDDAAVLVICCCILLGLGLGYLAFSLE